MDVPPPWQQLNADLWARVAGFLQCNEVACSLRLVNRASAAALRGSPHHTTVLLSEPVPQAAYAHRWGAPGAVRSLTLERRRKLMNLTCASGILANVELAAVVVGCLLTEEASAAAAGRGHGHICRWLRDKGCPWSAAVAERAAGAGHLDLLRWLRAEGCPMTFTGIPGNSASASAAREGREAVLLELLPHQSSSTGVRQWHAALLTAAEGGQTALIESLMELQPRLVVHAPLLEAAATGCDLATLQQLCGIKDAGARPGGTRQQHVLQQEEAWEAIKILYAAVSSRTADWAEKGEYLLARGYQWDWGHCGIEARLLMALFLLDDAEERLLWMRSRGFRPTEEDALALLAAEAAAMRGDLQALRHRLESLAVSQLPSVAEAAARRGQLPALELLREYGCPMGHDVAAAAAQQGHKDMLEWVLDGGGAGAGGDSITAAGKDAGAAGGNNTAGGVGASSSGSGRDGGEDAGSSGASDGGGARRGSTRSGGSMARPPAAVELAASEGTMYAGGGTAGGGGGGAIAGGSTSTNLHQQQQQEPECVLTAALFAAAAKSGSVALLASLRARGCPMDEDVWSSAAEAGCEDSLRWLASEGCPLPESGTPYLAAGYTGDMATLRCLRTLGCPWHPTTELMARAVQAHDCCGNSKTCRAPVLDWLWEPGRHGGDGRQRGGV